MAYRTWIPKVLVARQQARKVDWPEREKAEEERELRAPVRPVEMQMIREVGHAINALI